jgi:transposase
MKKLTEFDYGKIIVLYNQGMSVRDIEKEIGIPKSTVGDFIKIYREKGYIEKKVRFGRSLSIKSEELEIIKKIHTKNPKISAPRINKIFSEKTNIIVSNQTIRNSLNKLGFSACRALKRPFLSKKKYNCPI